MPETLQDVLEIARGYSDGSEHRALNIVIAWWRHELDLMLLVPLEGDDV